jgi:hypothetical protein
VRSREFRRKYKQIIQELIQRNWWLDDHRAVRTLLIKGVQLFGAEFVADSLRWLFAKATTKIRSTLFRSSVHEGSTLGT